MAEGQVERLPHEGFYGGTMPLEDASDWGQVLSIDPVTKRLSGRLIRSYRTFKDAYFLMGGNRWGVTGIPRVNDLVFVQWDDQGQAYASTVSLNYGALLKGGDSSLADSGYADLSEGELHIHSFGHSETYYDNTGSWAAYDSMGDFIQVNALDSEIRLRAIQTKLEEIGFKDDGSPGVVIKSGLQDGLYDEQNNELKPKKSQWVLTVDNKIVMDASQDPDGTLTFQGPSNTFIYVDKNGIRVEGANIKVVGTTGVDVESDNITHNSGDEPVVLGNQLKDFINQLLTAIQAITVPTGVGPSGTPINSTQFTTLKTNFIDNGTIFSDKSKVAK